MVTSEGNAPAFTIRDNDDAVDHVMNLVYRVWSTATIFKPALPTKGAAYINALGAAVAELDRLRPVHAVPLKDDVHFWTYKIKVHTKWALDSGLNPDVVRLLATIHFS